jgi:phosphohistidine phosphatase
MSQTVHNLSLFLYIKRFNEYAKRGQKMKKLILMRHAKAVKPEETNVPDIERKLEERGIKDSQNMGEFLKHEGWIPEKIFCSPSIRTKETLDLVLRKLKENIPVQFEEAIYGNDQNEIIKLISGIDDSLQLIMLIGHNPSIENLAVFLTGETFPDEKFGTACIAVIELNQWDKIKKQSGKLVLFQTPKTLG